MKKSSIFIHLQVRLKSGGKREGKGQKQYSQLFLSFRKSEEKEWERGMRKRKGAKLLWALLGPLQPHAEETIIEVNGKLLNSFRKSSSSSSFSFWRHRPRYRPSTSGTSTVSKSVMRERRTQRVEIAFATCCLCFCVDYLTGYLTTPESSVIHMPKIGRMERQTCREFT